MRKGDEVDLEELGETLAQLGYERVTSIEQKELGRRGDIVDIFPVSSELPVGWNSVRNSTSFGNSTQPANAHWTRSMPFDSPQPVLGR